MDEKIEVDKKLFTELLTALAVHQEISVIMSENAWSVIHWEDLRDWSATILARGYSKISKFKRLSMWINSKLGFPQNDDPIEQVRWSANHIVYHKSPNHYRSYGICYKTGELTQYDRGEPIIYGVCDNKLHLDQFRHPNRAIELLDHVFGKLYYHDDPASSMKEMHDLVKFVCKAPSVRFRY